MRKAAKATQHGSAHSVSGEVSPIVALCQGLSRYNAASLLESAGALQLMPENADRTIRLEAFANAAATLSDDSSRPGISRGRLRAILNSQPLGIGPIADAEDPFENMFTEAITFFGGSYVVFPGITADAGFITRCICQGLFRSATKFPDGFFLKNASGLVHSVLALSDETARRCRLNRGVSPVPAYRRKLIVPNHERFESLKEAVSFTETELGDALAARGATLPALGPLIRSPGDGDIADHRIREGQLLTSPIMSAAGRLIVAAPGSLLPAMWNQLIRLAVERDMVGELAARYHHAVRRHIVRCLSYIENSPVRPPFPETPSIRGYSEAFFGFDTDKLLCAVLVTDPITHYDPSKFPGDWPAGRADEFVATRLSELQNVAGSIGVSADSIMFLVVLQGIGRPHFLGADWPDPSPVLCISAADLETILLLEGGDPLVLWKYALAASRIRENTEICAWTSLDEFAFYKSCGYSYYASDEARPDLLIMGSDLGLSLRRQVAEQRDFHGVPSHVPGYVTEVTTLHGTHNVPIYVPLDSIANADSDRTAITLEGLPLPVWIIAAPDAGWQGSKRISAELADAVAYWLWQCTPALWPVLEPLTASLSQILIQIHATPGDAWTRPEVIDSTESAESVTAIGDRSSGVVRVTLRPSLAALLVGADNAGERYLMKKVLVGIREILPEAGRDRLSCGVIEKVIDEHAPLGTKKKLLFLDTRASPEIDPRGIPSYRRVQEWDKSGLLDELGVWLADQEHLQPGPIDDCYRTPLLGRTVKFFYDMLAGLVESLSPRSLLEYLVAQHESILRRSALNRLTIPTRLACFSSESDLVRNLVEEIPEVSRAGLAARFLVEYVVARPPSGTRTLSLSIYDRLLAIASCILDLGFQSDLVHFKLADFRFSILGSGRLGADRVVYRKALDTYLPILASGEIGRAARAFGRHWPDKRETVEPPQEVDEIDIATAAELGFSLTDINSFVMAAMLVGSSIDPGLVVMPADELVRQLTDKLGWAESRAQGLLDLLSLDPRKDFLSPPSPYRKEDVYPWRYRRSYSYVRRPFLRRIARGVTEVLWGARSLWVARNNLIALCLNGRIKAESPEMRKLVGKLNGERGQWFNDRVADVLQRSGSLIVRRRVKKVGALKGTKGPPGDIDVLAADPKRRRLFVIECKDLAAGRAPHELYSEMANLFLTLDGKPSIVERHQKRIRWVGSNLADVLAWLKVPKSGRWKVTALVVVDHELLTPFLAQSPVRVVSLAALEKELSSLG